MISSVKRALLLRGPLCSVHIHLVSIPLLLVGKVNMLLVFARSMLLILVMLLSANGLCVEMLRLDAFALLHLPKAVCATLALWTLCRVSMHFLDVALM